MLAWKAKGDNEWDPMTGHGLAYLNGVGDFHEKMREALRVELAKVDSNPDDFAYGFERGLEEAFAILENLKP